MPPGRHPQPIRLLLVEDHRLVREGLRALLRDEPGLTVVGEAGDGQEALRQAAALQPDVVVMDVSLAGLDGLETTRRLRQGAPGARVLVLTMHRSPAMVERALAAGARGYVLKGGDLAELCEAVRAVHRGEQYFTRAVGDYLPRAPPGAGDGAPPALTVREAEVLHLVSEGLTSRQVAERLGVSPKTVENHRANIREKLGVHTTAELVRYALGRPPSGDGAG